MAAGGWACLIQRMWIRSIMVAAVFCGLAHAGVRSGNAEAGLLVASGTCEPNGSIDIAIQLKIDDGWHTYWVNPGEGGMAPKLTLTLPDGWRADGLEFPVPQPIVTGNLAGFGYEKTVTLPVRLHAPADFTGKAVVQAKLEWLTCNDGACVPGEAELRQEITAGAPTPTEDAGTIVDARALLPKPVAGLKLIVAEEKGRLALSLLGKTEINFNGCEAYPVTEHALQNGGKIVFQGGKSGAASTALAKKSEYQSEPLKELSLVLTGKNLPHPVLVTWQKAQ